LWQRTEIQALLYINSVILKAEMVSFIRIRVRYEANPKCTKSHIFAQTCTIGLRPFLRQTGFGQSRFAVDSARRQCVKMSRNVTSNRLSAERRAKPPRKEQRPPTPHTIPRQFFADDPAHFWRTMKIHI
jgi:hypothetical protein